MLGFPDDSGNNLPLLETQVWSMGGKDSLEKEMVTHSGILAWETPRTEKPDGPQFVGLQRIRHDLATKQQQQKQCAGSLWLKNSNSKLGITDE